MEKCTNSLPKEAKVASLEGTHLPVEDPLPLVHQEVAEDHLVGAVAADPALEALEEPEPVEVTGSWEATPLRNSTEIAPLQTRS